LGNATGRILDDAPPEWTALVARDPNATATHRRAAWSALALVLPTSRVRFVAIEENGELVGGMPVVIERRAGLDWIHAMPLGLSGAPLARAGAHADVDRVACSTFSRMQRDLAAAGGLWTWYRPCGPEPEPAELERVSGEIRWTDAWNVDLEEGIEAARRRLDSDLRYDLRHAGKRGLICIEEPAALEEAYALHLGQRRQWPGTRAVPLEVSRRMLAAGDASGPVARLFTARDRRGLVGAILFLDHEREIMAWWSGARPEARAERAIALLYWSVAEWAARAGRARLNLGASVGRPGLQAFKGSLGARRIRVRALWLDARHARWPGRLAASLRGRLARRSEPGEGA
jgi:CelD/BcsL family acetyltransferase involved in cellulose biosynthesis